MRIKAWTVWDGHVVGEFEMEQRRTVEVDDRLLAELIEAARQVVRHRGGHTFELYARVDALERSLIRLSESIGSQVEAEAQTAFKEREF